MPEIAINKNVRVNQFHVELAAALGGAASKILRIVGTGDVGDGVAASGVVVHDGTLTGPQTTTVNNAITAHTPTQSNRAKLVAQAAQAIADLDTAIAALVIDTPATWNNNARDIVEGICRNQKKIIQYLIDQAIT